MRVDIIRLESKVAKAAVSGFEAIVACEEGRMTREKAERIVAKANAEVVDINSNNGDATEKYWTRYGVQPFDFFATKWESNETYRAYLQATIATIPQTGNAELDNVRAHIEATKAFRKDLRPLLLNSDITGELVGHSWEVIRQN